MAKKAIVERALGIAIPPVRSVGPDFGYRDRAKLTVGKTGTLGFHARRSHDVVDLGEPPRCPLLGPELARKQQPRERWPAAWRRGSSTRRRWAPRGST